MIPSAAALHIFNDVWAEYSALCESDHRSPDISQFLIDVERAFAALFPTPFARRAAISSLLDHPSRGYTSTRIQLGNHFLAAGFWPCSAYFAGNSSGNGNRPKNGETPGRWVQGLLFPLHDRS